MLAVSYAELNGSLMCLFSLKRTAISGFKGELKSN